MRLLKFNWVCLLLTLTGLFASASCQQQVDPQDQWMIDVGKSIDPVAKGLDEWGSASMSNPLLTTPDSSFSFDLKRTGADYYNDARSDINGGVGESTEQSSLATSGTAFQANLDTAVKAALAASTGGIAALPSLLQPSTAPAIGSDILPTTLPASSVFTLSKFAALQSLLGDKLVLDNRTAIGLAAGDKVTQDILSYLAGPSTAAKFKDKIVLFGTGMVSVQPGWRTSSNYAADLVVSVGYLPVAARTAVLTKLPLLERIALYKACVRENWRVWSDKSYAASTQPSVQNITSETELHRAYDRARLHYMESLLYEARTLVTGSGISIDTTPLYKAAASRAPSTRGIGGLQYKPTTEPTAEELTALARKIDDVAKGGNRQIRVLQLRSDSTGEHIVFVPDNIVELLKCLEAADMLNQISFADTLRTALKTLQQEVEDARNIRKAMEFANTEWPATKEGIAADGDIGALALPATRQVNDETDATTSFELPLQRTTTLTAQRASTTKPAIGPYIIGTYSGNSGTTDYSDPFTGKLGAGGDSPYVAAVLPMSDSQILDLKESSRSQQEKATKLALALSFLGAQAQAQAFDDYARKQQEDIATISSDNVELTYSTGDIIGFQVSPRLKAVASLSDTTKSKAAMILDPTSFPTLFVIGLDQEDTRLFPWKNRDGIYVPGEFEIQFRQTTRWLPLPLNPGGRPSKVCHPEELAETVRATWEAKLTGANRAVKRQSEKSEESDADVESILNRIDYLNKLMIDDWNTQYLPADVVLASYPQPPVTSLTVSDIVPRRFYVSQTGRPATQPTFVIIGSGFKGLGPDAVNVVVPDGVGLSAKVGTSKVVGDSAISITLLTSGQLIRSVPIYFTVTYKTETDELKTLITPPVMLENFDATALKLVKTDSKDEHGATKNEVEFSPQIDPNVVDRFLKGPQTQPSLSEFREWRHKDAVREHEHRHD